MGIPAARPFELSVLRPVQPLGSDPPLHEQLVKVPLIADGRYSGGNAEVVIELRVDWTGCGVISGDLFRLLPDSRHYVASFRTVPGTRVNGTGPWGLTGQDEHGRFAVGSLELTAQTDTRGSILGRFRFEGSLEGLPSRIWIPFAAQYTARTFRSLGIEKEIEEGVKDIDAYIVGERHIDVAEAFRMAGFDTRIAGITDRIPRSAQGWDMAQLHTLMSDLGQAPLLRRSWDVHLLLLSHSDRKGLLGVMFDSSDPLPRQGCAVFAEEIRGIAGIDHERKLIQTTVHELGHALNLAHRFERVVGRADSLSFMNYDWRYRGGRREAEYWNQFTFNFDPDEIEFLRHAPLPPLIPGGAPFHSVPYWSGAEGGYSPYVPEVPLSGWILTLMPPDGGAVLRFAQPVLMRVLLTNKSGRTVEIPKFLLDPKAGFLEVMVRRVHSGAVGRDSSASESFTPVMQRCFQWDAADAVRLREGESIDDNINVTFGSGGFAFAEPGSYDVTTLLAIFDDTQQRELIATSNTVRLRIGAPRNDQDEREAVEFFTPEVGMYLALGGSAALPRAQERLDEIAERRKHDLKDPLVAHITRTRALDRARSYIRYHDREFHVSEPHIDEAATALMRLREVPYTFDAATARQMAHLGEMYQAKLEGKDTKGSLPRTLEPTVLSPNVSANLVMKARESSYSPGGRKRFTR